ncbi:MAG: hypothetical protein F4Y42_08270 [Caldilineaceae bacterium SB0664_bin_27]|uniref:SWIM-type domain-containing protein n=1 Tax=Caldilineaceae bacterium SB0664_bin_27 TaxID=2605260 RepID=A0A6B0YS56_9CHLR|nr:hypothetical protein [Caldilineaceae bacterium SB0664_bin_27]
MTKAPGKEGSWAARWHEYMKAQGFDLKRGQALARRLQVEAVDVQFGRIKAEVAESHRGSCEIEIDIPPLGDDEWSAVLDALAGEALYAAQLLAGGNEWETFLAVLDAVFSDAQVALLSRSPVIGEVEARCSECFSQGTPCRHTLAVLYRFGQMISEDPWQLLLLRGRDRQQVLTGLRLRRSHDAEEDLRGEGETSDSATDPLLAGYDGLRALDDSAIRQDESIDLAAQIDTFWGGRQLGPGGTRQDLRALHYKIAPPLIRMALLRRLGPPPFQQDSPEIYDRLAEIYFEVSSKALELAFAPEPDSDGSV